MVAPYYGNGKEPTDPTETSVIDDHILGLESRIAYREKLIAVMGNLTDGALPAAAARHTTILHAEQRIVAALNQLRAAVAYTSTLYRIALVPLARYAAAGDMPARTVDEWLAAEPTAIMLKVEPVRAEWYAQALASGSAVDFNNGRDTYRVAAVEGRFAAYGDPAETAE